MKMHKSIVDSRRKKIYELIKANSSMSVEKLAEATNVSLLTIRRDLDFLENNELIERFYGGAKIINRNSLYSSSDEVNEIYHALAKKAAEFIVEGDTLFINTSSTALLTLKYVKNKRITVITNNGKAIFIEKDSNISIILTGGELREPKEAMVGEFAINNLNMVTASKSILGCSGITSESGITTAILQEVAINEIMLKRVTGPKIIVADGSKVGHNNSFISGAIGKIDILITDSSADKECVNKIRNNGVRVIIVD